MPVELQLLLPLEFVRLPYYICNESIDHISSMSIHRNETHELLPHGFGEITTYESNEFS